MMMNNQNSFIKKATQFSLFVAFCFVIAMVSSAFTTETAMQEKAIKGKITDGFTGGAIEGATITIEGSDVKVVSQKDGSYSIPLPKRAKKLVVSYTGYQTLEIDINDRTTINVTMSQSYQDPSLW